MHSAKNMVGERPANYNVSLFRRYFHMSKHRKPGRIKKTLVSLVTALEVEVGVLLYA